MVVIEIFLIFNFSTAEPVTVETLTENMVVLRRANVTRNAGLWNISFTTANGIFSNQFIAFDKSCPFEIHK